jgi:hypothetical protein
MLQIINIITFKYLIIMKKFVNFIISDSVSRQPSAVSRQPSAVSRQPSMVCLSD